ncbi:hypothetical protein RirG_254730 [Rhizophagus irregularis DAOM 197198w]|uniref:RNA-directed DNA polymerase from mobile element jockey-like n=1 Tax=Rhizophagus irregularis (strain DAOM 197198w) TaxID=1432141 RepID=A0A015I5D6_RHIIW|nr:hypothetical protein RirG_254730 [Rhizophagus irregularis DAOM 197198w]
MLSFSSSSTLNQIWHKFKTVLLSAARSHFSRKTISLMKPKTIPHELQPYIHLSHSLDHFTISLQKLISISRLNVSWLHFFINFEPAFKELFLNQSGLLNGLSHPSQLLMIFDSSNFSYHEFLIQFQKSLRKLKRFLSASNALEFDKFKTAYMKSAISERNINFYENKGKFISIASDEIKDAAISHFQNIVSPSVSPFGSLSSLPPRWQKRYSLLEQFHESLYDSVMSHISVSELCEAISASPVYKASGPSSIPYEWFKLLSDTSLQFLCELMNRCLDQSDIPEDWRSASIAPIPKLHEFNALLKNT